MRKIMVVLMVVALLAGVFAAVPALASFDVPIVDVKEEFETFNDSGLPAGWSLMEGTVEQIDQVDGLNGKALQLTGSADTDVVKISKKIPYWGWQSLEGSANYKLTAYENGAGFRVYFADNTTLRGANNPVTTVTDAWKSLAFDAHYAYNADRSQYGGNGNLVIEFSGTGTVLVDAVALIDCTTNGLIPNGDFEADTWSENLKIASNVTAGIEKDSAGNGYAYIAQATWSEAINIRVGAGVTPGKTYMVSFRYKSEGTTQPCVYLLFSTEAKPAVGNEIPRTKYTPMWYDNTDEKVIITPSTEWKTYHTSFTIPQDGETTNNCRILYQISLRGNGKAAKQYIDDIRIMEVAPEMEYTTSTDAVISEMPTAGETLRTRCFYAKNPSAVSETAMLVQAMYEEDASGVKRLVSVDIDNQTITAKNVYITAENTVPAVENGKTLVVESYLWNGTALKPILDGITLK